MPRTLLCLFALSLGCMPAEPSRSFSSPDEGVDDDEQQPGDDDDSTEPVQPGDDDDTAPLGDDDDTTSPVWDPAEPDAPDGTLAVFELQCGLLVANAQKTYERAGDRWNELRVEGEETVPRPELTPCFADGDKFLEWQGDGTLWFAAGGLAHFATPTATPQRWSGGVQPKEDRGAGSEQCAEALANAGLTWPITLGLQLLDVIEPGE